MKLTFVPIYIYAVYSAYSVNHLDVMPQKQSKTFLTFYNRASLGNICLASDSCVNWGISFLVEGNTCDRCNKTDVAAFRCCSGNRLMCNGNNTRDLNL